MSRDYPDWINPHKAAQARREFSGSVLLSRLTRVLDLIDQAEGAEIGFEVDFSLDDQREVRARVRVHGHVPMVCQRTLKRYMQPIDSASVIGVVDNARAAEALPEDYEPLILEEPRIRLEDLIAEELLLGLPLVPRAPDSEPVVDRKRSAPTETHRPFADLARLAGKADKD
ncbi:MAG: hypothetical protein EA419_02545 [Wenzhouxiangella sp.]|nr:MAG: hypothetical protein EA419_02545 [Wenzhouxiangella sp.]